MAGAPENQRADELRRAGIMTTLGGSYTLPFAR